ncbi:MAG: PIG-L family deacetylase [Verrucomicrobiales bacterium]|nr:PIG-L family deacetylase [Verrucomicrobiales bacterium]
MNILALGAHPDDIEILCAGTLALYAQQGHRVTMAVFTCGDMGDLAVPPAELARVRRSESEASAAILGARLLWPAVMDEHVFPNETQRRIMIDLLREADPDVILTHSPADYHPDHRYVSQLVFDAYFQKGLPHIPHQQQPACRFAGTQIYYMDTIAGIGFTPTEYVDITPVAEIKRRMLRCHESQFRAVSELAQRDLEQLADIQSRFRGLAGGCAHAEAFTRLETWQRGLSRRLLP